MDLGQLLWSLGCRLELLTSDYILDITTFDPAGILTLVCRVPGVLQRSFAFVDILRRFRLQPFCDLRGRQRDTYSLARERGLPGWLVSRIVEDTHLAVLPTFFIIGWGENIHQGWRKMMFLSSHTLLTELCLHLVLLRKVPNSRTCLDGSLLSV